MLFGLSSWRPVTLATVFLLAPACGGAFESGADDDDRKGDDGDGDVSGDGDGDSGDGDADPGDGDGVPDQTCLIDSDCVAVGVTNDPCYSPGCTLPTAVSRAAMLGDHCLVEWIGEQGPSIPTNCTPTFDEDVACAEYCAAPPACITPVCVAGVCQLNISQDAQDCEPGGTGGGGSDLCAELESERARTLNLARLCVPGGMVMECGDGASIMDECGCSVPVNSQNASDVQTAQEARAAWEAACEAPLKCQLVDCYVSPSASICSDSEGIGRCVWE